MLFWFGIIIVFCFNAIVFGEKLAGIAEVNFQLAFPLQAWIAYSQCAIDRGGADRSRARAVSPDAGKLSRPSDRRLPGAIFFASGWIIATKLFQFYVGRYDRYNPTYLALASIVVLLTWMYLTCLLLLLGGKLNAILRRERERMRRPAPVAPAPVARAALKCYKVKKGSRSDLFYSLTFCSISFA